MDAGGRGWTRAAGRVREWGRWGPPSAHGIAPAAAREREALEAREAVLNRLAVVGQDHRAVRLAGKDFGGQLADEA